MDFDAVVRDAMRGYARVPAMDRDRTEVRMSATTCESIWRHMIFSGLPYPWPDENDLEWDESKMNDATLFGMRVRRDDSIPYGEVQYWTRR